MTLEQAIAELKLKDEHIGELARQNEALDRTVEQLRQQIALLQRRLYGPRSEKYHPGQLFLDDIPMWVRESAVSEALTADSRTHNPISC